MLAPRQNALEVINGGNPEYIPCQLECYEMTGFMTLALMEAPFRPGKDPFGVEWDITPEGAIPSNRDFLLKDIADWREVVTIPDVEAIRDQVFAIAAVEAANLERENKLVQVLNDCGLFERLVAFMGFENALVALLEDPDECHEFFEAIADYKIACAKLVIEAYQPDVYVYFDDVANAKSLLMSPDVWREVIKPSHARIAQAITEESVIYEQHVCGYCTELLDDYVEMGARMWHSAQIMNDLPAIPEKYRGRLAVEGGWDTTGLPGRVDATGEDFRKEVRRCCSEYGQSGGFILFPTILTEEGNAVRLGDPRINDLMDEWDKCRWLDREEV